MLQKIRLARTAVEFHKIAFGNYVELSSFQMQSNIIKRVFSVNARLNYNNV